MQPLTHNLLVPGSSPGGPTNFGNLAIHCDAVFDLRQREKKKKCGKSRDYQGLGGISGFGAMDGLRRDLISGKGQKAKLNRASTRL